MLKYISFPVSDAEGINKFIQENSDGISRDGIVFLKDSIAIVYSDVKDTDREYIAVEQSIRQGIADLLLKIGENEVDLHWWQSQNLKANPKAPEMIIDCKNKREQLLNKLKCSRGLVEKLKNKTFENFEDIYKISQ